MTLAQPLLTLSIIEYVPRQYYINNTYFVIFHPAISNNICMHSRQLPTISQNIYLVHLVESCLENESSLNLCWISTYSFDSCSRLVFLHAVVVCFSFTNCHNLDMMTSYCVIKIINILDKTL